MFIAIERVARYARQRAEAQRIGDFSNWSASERLMGGNEVGGGRGLLGGLYLIPFYCRALSTDEVMLNFEAGP